MKNIQPLILCLIAIILQSTAIAQYREYPDNTARTNNNDCFCNVYEDIDRFNTVYGLLAEREAREWLENQEGILKDEIESRMREDYPSFGEAQRAWFKKVFTNRLAREGLNDLEDEYRGNYRDLTKRKNRVALELKVLSMRESEIRSNVGSDTRFGWIKYHDTRFRDMRSVREIDRFRSDANRKLENIKRSLDAPNRIMEGIRIVRENGFLINRLTNDYVHHYGSHGLEDRIRLMINYLIRENDLGPHDPSRFIPALYYTDGSGEAFQEVSIAGAFETVQIPNFPDENVAVRNFAINSLGERISDFLNTSSNQNLKIEVIRYMENYQYNIASLHCSNYLFDTYLAGSNFTLDTSLYNSSGTPGYQNSNDPNLALSWNPKPRAIQEGFIGFAAVLSKLFESNENRDYEGYIIRDMFNSNGLNVSSNIDNSDLGLFFNISSSDNANTEIRFIYNSGLALYSNGITLNSIIDTTLNSDPFDFEIIDGQARRNLMCPSGLNFSTLGDAKAINISNLGFFATNGRRSINVEYAQGICITLRNDPPRPNHYYESIIQNAWNKTMLDLASWLTNMEKYTIITSNAASNFIYEYFLLWLNTSHPGTFVNRGICPGANIQPIIYCP